MKTIIITLFVVLLVPLGVFANESLLQPFETTGQLPIIFERYPSLVFSGSSDREIFRLLPDGTVRLGPGVSNDEVTQTFWQRVEQMSPGICERLLQRRKEKP